MAEFKVGDHVIATTKEAAVKGVVAFYGEAEFAPGVWVGVRLKDPGK